MLSSASAPGFSSKTFDPLTCCKSLFVFTAQQRPTAYTKCIHLCECWHAQEFFPADPLEVRPLCCAPLTTGELLDTHRSCRSRIQPSWTGTRSCCLEQQHAEEAAWSTAAAESQEKLAGGWGNRIPSCRGSAGAGIFLPAEANFSQEMQSCLSAMTWSLSPLHWLLVQWSKPHLMGISPTSRTQAFSPAPVTGRLCIRNGVLGCILAGQWGQASVWQSQTFVSPTVELHPVAICCYMDGIDP